MAVGSVIELSPLFLALPSLLVSSTLTSTKQLNQIDTNINNSHDPDLQSIPETDNIQSLHLDDRYNIPILESILLASFLLLVLSILVKVGMINPNNSVTPITSTTPKRLNSVTAVLRNIFLLVLPLSALFFSNFLISPLSLLNLLVITLLINRTSIKSKHMSIKLQKSYSMDESTVMVCFKKYQVFAVYLISFLFDVGLALFNGTFNFNLVIGYLILLIPIFVFLNPLGFETVEESKQSPNLTVSFLFTVFSLLSLLTFQFEEFNFKMIFISVGCLIILIFSQLDLDESFSSRTFFDKDVFLLNYKINLAILNVIMVIIQHICVNGDTNFTDTLVLRTFVTQNLPRLIITAILICIIKPVEPSSSSSNDSEITEKDNKDEKAVTESTFFGLLYQMFHSKEIRSIFNFLLLNISFMFIQLLYSFRSKSLSLLSDSLHMFLDCLSLFLGLMASLIAKNNREHPSKSFPFGLARIETLCGFANGSLLLGIVLEIFNEAFQRIIHPVGIEKTTELLIVSVLGLIVNLVGIFAFNHGHPVGEGGHSHSHALGGGHSHSHASSGPHSDSHVSLSLESTSRSSDLHECSDSSHSHSSHSHSHESHSHSHSHKGPEPCTDSHKDDDHVSLNDNMQGIFLHILADTLGSVGVILSTIIVKFTGWKIIDPITSVLIALLIFISAVPLLKSSSSNLLMGLQDKPEQQLKDILNEILKIPGVKSYTTPRFWPENDANSELIGYLHIQFYKSENSLTIKAKAEKLMEGKVKKCFLQLENEIDDCWCRNDGVFSSH